MQKCHWQWTEIMSHKIPFGLQLSFAAVKSMSICFLRQLSGERDDTFYLVCICLPTSPLWNWGTPHRHSQEPLFPLYSSLYYLLNSLIYLHIRIYHLTGSHLKHCALPKKNKIFDAIFFFLILLVNPLSSSDEWELRAWSSNPMPRLQQFHCNFKKLYGRYINFWR